VAEKIKKSRQTDKIVLHLALDLGHKDAKMLNVSKTAQYGLQGLLYLARYRDRGFIKIDEISKEEDIPANYLRKIFQQLIKNRIVESGLGPRGGVCLTSRGEETSIARLIKIFDGEPVFDKCSLFGTSGCPNLTGCPLHKECRTYDRSVWHKLENYTLKDMFNEESGTPIRLNQVQKKDSNKGEPA
jgi:Rrf2 family protein